MVTNQLLQFFLNDKRNDSIKMTQRQELCDFRIKTIRRNLIGHLK